MLEGENKNVIPPENSLSSSLYEGGNSLALSPPDVYPLSLAEARSALFWSFFLSQGNTVLHGEVFRYIALHRQHWRFPPQQQNALYHQIEELIRKMMHKKKHAYVERETLEWD